MVLDTKRIFETIDRMDAEVDLTAACVFRLDGEQISDYRIYMDINPLYAES